MRLSHKHMRTSALALSMTVVMAASLGVALADANPRGFDMDPHPVKLPAKMHTPMTAEESAYVARQLTPIPRYVAPKKGPRPKPLAIVTPRTWGDSFIADDWSVASRHDNGDVVRKRESTFGKLFFPGSKTYQYVYRSTDGRGYPVLATASLVVPPHVKPNASTFVWAQFQNSSGTKCDIPSQFNKPTPGWTANNPQIAAALLAGGHPVLFTNGLGPRSAYPMNRSSARYILDAMRMVHKQRDFTLKKSTFVGLGVSHGALQMGYTAVEQPYYAPDLTKFIRQLIIHEGAPDFLKVASAFGMYGDSDKYPALFGSFVVNFVIGLSREYPDKVPNLEYWLTDRGKRALKVARNACAPASFIAGTGVVMKDYFKPGFLKSKTFRAALDIAKYNSSMYFPGKPAVPVMLVHGSTDLILYQAEQDYILHQRWCKAGVNSVYQEVPLAGHSTLPSLSAPRVIASVVLPLEGVIQKPYCPGKVII